MNSEQNMSHIDTRMISLRAQLGLSPHRYNKRKDGIYRSRGISAQDIIIHEHKRLGWEPGMTTVPREVSR